MPNGSQYIPEWCEERHDRIDQTFEKVWAKFQRQDKLLWSIVLVLVANLGGVMGILLKLVLG